MEKILAKWFSLNEKLRYLLVGGFNTVFAYLIFCLLQLLLATKFHYLAILSISYFISVFNSFINFRVFVFRSCGHFWHEYLKVNFVYFWHFILNAILLYLLKDYLKINVFIAQLICVTTLVILVYFAHKYFSFRKT